MQLLRQLDELNAACEGGVCMTIGVFDGIHRGHQVLITKARDAASDLGIRSLVFTFERHPLAVLAPAYCPPTVIQPEQKADLIDALGVDLCLMLQFTPEFAAIPAEDFIREILVQRCRARYVACGSNFSFGQKARGNVHMLREWGAQLGFKVEEIESVGEGSSLISSTRIREHLMEGDVITARSMLARPYSLRAKVVRGDARGRQIGFPTANLQPVPDQLIPADGVYAVRVKITDEAAMDVFGGMLNIGHRPTFQAGRSIEVHIFDFDGDLVGRDLEVEFIDRIRDEKKFSGVEELVSQLNRDKVTSRSILSGSGN